MPKRLPWPVPAAAAFVFLASSLLGLIAFERTPHIHDEIDYVFQAKLFLSGRLSAPSPCARDFFDFPHMINNGRWYSMYTPGYPLLLAAGLGLGVPWLVNPLLAALCIFLFYALGSEVYDRRTGVLSALLGAASIWLLLMSASLMSHTSSLFFASLFLLFFFRSLRTPSAANGLLAGIGLGAMALIRPYNALIFSFPFLLVLIWKSLREFRTRARNITALAGGAAIFMAALALYNTLTNGSPFRMGYTLVYGENVFPGFGHSGLPGMTFTAFQGMENIILNLKALNRDLFGWPLSSLAALLPLVLIPGRPAPERRRDLLLASGIFSMLAGLFLYWGTFVLLGPRLMFETVVLLVVLSARGILELLRVLEALMARKARTARILTAGLLILLVGYGFCIRFPRWIWPKDTGFFNETIGRNLAGTSPAIGRTLSALPLGRAVVLMRMVWSPNRFFPNGGWGSGFLFNAPDLKSDVIYARDQGPENVRLMDCHPDRRFFLYTGNLEKGMLLPMERKGDSFAYGPPVTHSPESRGRVRLVDRPQEIFNLYSKDFESFLDELARSEDWTAWDVPHLLERGVLYRRNLDYGRAAFAFEAALQLETDPLWRETLLNLLQTCYYKLGLRAEAERIRRRMIESGFDPKKYYGVLPERGF